MITPQEAQRRAQQLLEEYVAGALCTNPEDVAHVLMKLISVTGVAIASLTGQDDAVRRMQLCAEMVRQIPPAKIPGAEFVKPRPTTPGMGY